MARRHKIANPERMRTDYGKMIYLLQDAQRSEVVDEIGFPLVKPLVTVHSFLESRNALALLQDAQLELATRDISSLCKNRQLVEWELKQKVQSRKDIVQRWTEMEDVDEEDALEEKDVLLVLESIGDSNSYLRDVRDPCDEMIS